MELTPSRRLLTAATLAVLALPGTAILRADTTFQIPALTAPVNDFARVIDPKSAAEMDRRIRALQQASGDTVVVTTIKTFAPAADIREYAVRMFENGGRGIGQRGKDNGVLILLAVEDHHVWIEVGYDVDQFVTDGFAGEISRDVMTPRFREGDYGGGLLAGVTRVSDRIASGRNVSIDGRPVVEGEAPRRTKGLSSRAIFWILVAIIFFVAASGGLSSAFRPRRRHRRPGHWGRGSWSGWSSGVGPFGGGGGSFGGGFGGFGGGGGGFGGFGGGRSGGGGGGGSW